VILILLSYYIDEDVIFDYPAEVTFPPLLQPINAGTVLDLTTPEGCETELTLVTY